MAAALKDLSRARQVFGPDVPLMQAPLKNRFTDSVIRTPFTFAHILHNMGYDDVAELSAMVQAWRAIFDYIHPDMVLFDHSPTALLAGRGYRFRKVVIGSGFCVPPDQSPLPNLRPWVKPQPAGLVEHERRILGNMNAAMEAFGTGGCRTGVSDLPLQRITQLYAEVDETLLLTFEELDHYPGRQNARYWGAYPEGAGERPLWPEGKGQRIFGYLKDFPALPQLLESLAKSGHPTLIVPDGIPPALRRQYAGATVRFSDRSVNMLDAARECDLAILNAGHGATVAMLLAGKPVLLIPIYLEQVLLARAVEQRLGAGLSVPKDGKQLQLKLTRMLESSEHTRNAARFAAEYSASTLEGQIGRILARLDELLAADAGS